MNTKHKLPDPKKAKKYFAKKLAFTTGPIELSRWLNSRADIKIVDVRGTKDYERGHIPGAISLPREKWHKLAALEADKVHIAYCYSQVCHLAASAAYTFASAGFSAMELEGGFDAWKACGLAVEKPSAAGKAREQAAAAQTN